MKKILFYLLILSLAVGCRRDEVDLYSSSEVTPTVGIADDELRFDGKTEEAKIFIKANFWWTAAVTYPSGANEQWCSITPEEGFGNIEVDVTSTRNFTASPREALITITADGGNTPFTKTFTVTQEPSSPYIEVKEVDSAGDYPVSVAEYDYILTLMANRNWKAEVTGQNTGWCTVTPSGQTGRSELGIGCGINTTGAPRAATVTISLTDDPGVKYVFMVKQGDIFDKSTLSVTRSPGVFSASWTPVVGAAGYMIDVYDMNGALVGSIDAGMETSKDLAADPFFGSATPTWAGYSDLVVRTLSTDAAIYSEGDPVSTNSHFTSGKGTQAEPFMIGDIESLRNITAANSVAANDGAYYKLDYDPAPDASFAPICTPSEPFKGIFDGNGKTIAGWAQTITPALRTFTGLFGGLSANAKVSALTFSGCSITLDKANSDDNYPNNSPMAFVAAVNNGEISNITVINSSIKATVDKGAYAISTGMIAGMNYGTIRNCTTRGGIISCDRKTGMAAFNCGGIAGNNLTANGLIDGCVNESAEIYANTEIGGIVGKNDGKITNTSNRAKVSGMYGVGGIYGAPATNGNSTSQVMNCYNSGTITVDFTSMTGNYGASYVGGIAGLMRSKGEAIVNSFNSGDIIIIGHPTTMPGSNLRVGGIVGRTQDNGAIINCYNRGKIEAKGEAGTSIFGINLGGIVGLMENGPTVTNCYSVGTVATSNLKSGSNVGDLIGDIASGSVVSSYAIADGAGAFIGRGGTIDAVSGRKTPAELQGTPTAAVFVGWDFNAVWQQNSGGSYQYPTLRANPQ